MVTPQWEMTSDGRVPTDEKIQQRAMCRPCWKKNGGEVRPLPAEYGRAFQARLADKSPRSRRNGKFSSFVRAAGEAEGLALFRAGTY